MIEPFTVCSHRTPELFAEYREPEALPPGPAFIQFTEIKVFFFDPTVYETALNAQAAAYNVPKGYLWQPATDHTPAGWVRPRYPDNRTTESGVS